MGKKFDDTELRQIFEKIERGEPLGTREKIYGRIVQVLRTSKQKKVVSRTGFKEGLKRNLLNQYDEIYSKKPWFSQTFGFWNSPFLRYSVSFCFVFFVGIGIYGSLYEFPGYSSGKNFGQSATVSNPTLKSVDYSSEERAAPVSSSPLPSVDSVSKKENSSPSENAFLSEKDSQSLMDISQKTGNKSFGVSTPSPSRNASSSLMGKSSTDSSPLDRIGVYLLYAGGVLVFLMIGYFTYKRKRKSGKTKQ